MRRYLFRRPDPWPGRLRAAGLFVAVLLGTLAWQGARQPSSVSATPALAVLDCDVARAAGLTVVRADVGWGARLSAEPAALSCDPWPLRR